MKHPTTSNRKFVISENTQQPIKISTADENCICTRAGNICSSIYFSNCDTYLIVLYTLYLLYSPKTPKVL